MYKFLVNTGYQTQLKSVDELSSDKFQIRKAPEVWEFFKHKIPFKCRNLNFAIAGGSLCDYFSNRKDLINDIDLFFSSEQDRNKMRKILVEEYGLKPIYSTANTECFKFQGIKLDLIKRYYTHPWDCIEFFDISVVSCALTPGGDLVFSKDFFEDIVLKRIRINNLSNAMSAFFRIPKYIKKGFSISREEMVKILTDIRNTPASQVNAFINALQTPTLGEGSFYNVISDTKSTYNVL